MVDFAYPRPMLERVIRQAATMDRMVDAVGADTLAVVRAEQGGAWFTARSRCIACPSAELCRDWLEDLAPGDQQDPPRFCPNGSFLLACRPPRPQAGAAPGRVVQQASI